MDSIENYKDIDLPLYLLFYKVNTKSGSHFRGIKVAIREAITKKMYSKIFLFENYNNLETLDVAKTFIKNDKKFLEIKKFKDKNCRKQRVLSYEENIKYYCKKFNIKKFPTILNNNKFIGIDQICNRFVFIKECIKCKKHSNVCVHDLDKSLNGLCKDCLIKINYFGRKYKYLQVYYLNEEKTRMIFSCNMAKKILYFNKNLNAKNYGENFKDIIKLYEDYFLYIIDNFIINNDLNFKKNLDQNTFLRLKSKYKTLPLVIKPPKYKINKEVFDRYKLIKHLHTFKAKIEVFGIHKTSGDKTVLLTEVEYIGIDNFRDHLWTEFSKELDLPVGTTITFKGEIYNYEKDYKGHKLKEKEGQSIKIMELLEVNTSTRNRVKLYK